MTKIKTRQPTLKYYGVNKKENNSGCNVKF